MALELQLPRLRRRALTVWARNLRVWGKLIGPALLMNFGEPLIYLLGIGYGLGLFIDQISDLSYMTFLASGVIASSAMQAATFEGMYSVFTRLVPQGTYEAMLCTPLDCDDIIGGELLWCATKALISGTAILIVATLLDAVGGWNALWAIPLLFLIGLCFAALAIVVSAISPGYDFFTYYVTLIITPMFVLCGVFYPVSSLPPWLQHAVAALPLTHAVALVRPLVAGAAPQAVATHVLVLLAYGAVGYYVAVVLVRRRLRL